MRQPPKPRMVLQVQTNEIFPPLVFSDGFCTSFASGQGQCHNWEHGGPYRQSNSSRNINTYHFQNGWYVFQYSLKSMEEISGARQFLELLGRAIKFAIEHHNWQVHHWRPVLFTDQSRFNLSTCNRHEKDWNEIKSLDFVRPYSGAVGPGFLQGHTNVQSYVAEVCGKFLEDERIRDRVISNWIVYRQSKGGL